MSIIFVWFISNRTHIFNSFVYQWYFRQENRHYPFIKTMCVASQTIVWHFFPVVNVFIFIFFPHTLYTTEKYRTISIHSSIRMKRICVKQCFSMRYNSIRVIYTMYCVRASERRKRKLEVYWSRFTGAPWRSAHHATPSEMYAMYSDWFKLLLLMYINKFDQTNALYVCIGSSTTVFRLLCFFILFISNLHMHVIL